MADEQRDLLRQTSWSATAADEKTTKSRILSAYPATRSNLLTLLLAIVIIAGGYLVPTLLYPMMDRSREVTVVLKDPATDSLATHVFPEPVPLYPWNLYRIEDCRALLSSERSLLSERGVADFLLASLTDRGLVLPLDESGLADTASYRETIIDGFSYLDVEQTSEPDCFVLVDLDVDADGVPDISCAVDHSGTVISLIFLAPQWDTVSLTAEDYPPPEAEPAEGVAENTAPNSDAAAVPGTETPGDEGVEGEGGPDDEAAAGNTDELDSNSATAGEGEGESGGEGVGEEADGAAEPIETINLEYLPMEEDERLWAFSYATMHEATAFEQPDLAAAFAVLNESFQYRYGYSYRLYLLFQSGKALDAEEAEATESGGGTESSEAKEDSGATESGEATENGEATESGEAAERSDAALIFPLTPTVFATAENLLYIYDLPEGARAIIYLDPATKRCVGFNLMSS
ncbi:MAG: hypothetical protein LBO07_03990 [Coriobacteriales bacterium]|jgi:hypothetical protein|nr:hypothetical protein [Coriobacteriales bacterium]